MGLGVDDDASVFFRELVLGSHARRSVSEEAQVYAVGLLVGMVSDRLPEEPLSFLLLGSMGPDRIVVLKDVGDAALFVSGFYPEHLERRGLCVGFYASIGSQAYSELASRFPARSRGLFLDLARSFGALRDVIGDVRRACDRMSMETAIGAIPHIGGHPDVGLSLSNRGPLG